MKPEPKRPVSVEDLLRLKRSERPAPEFWTRFDQELRAKQLSALVGKRPWWQRMAWQWPQVRRPLLTLGGAGAAVIVAFISVRQDPAPRTLVPVHSLPAGAALPEVSAEPALAPSNPSPVPVAVMGEQAAIPVRREEELLPAVAQAREVARVEDPGPTPVEVRGLLVGNDSPSARSIAANLAAVQSVETAGLGRKLLPHGEARAVVRTVAAVEPLAQMSAPAEARRARFRSALASNALVEGVRTDERMARSLSDERMSDSIRRFDAKGDRFSVKF